MWKKVFKNAILALCVLALVFQPVAVFAEEYTYTDTQSFVSTVNSAISYTSSNNTNTFFVDTLSTNFTNTFNNLKSNFSITDADIDIIVLATNGTSVYMVSALASNHTVTSSYPNGLTSGNPYLTIYTANTLSKTIYEAYYSSNSNSTSYSSRQFTQTPYNWNYYLGQNNGRAIFAGYYPINFVFSPTNQFSDIYYLNYNGSGGGEGGGDDGSSTDLSTIETYLANLYLQNGLLISNNFRSYTPDGTPVNSSWVGVGEYLTYMMLCQQQSVGVNKSYSVSYTNQAGNTVTKTNWLAWMGDWLLEATNHLYYIRNNITSASSDISDINERLELAFPDDQADMNDHIADTLLDDTNGNGLTISKISSAKSNLDDGLDTFKLDTSQSQYSNPFSALNNADWSFWSQTTLNNLGSGYSYSFGEGSLMSEDDVFTENQNDLLNLLGW